MDKNKLIKFAKILDTILNGLRLTFICIIVFCIIAFAILLVAQIVSPDITFGAKETVIDIGSLTFTVDEPLIATEKAWLMNFYILLIIPFAYLPFSCYCIKLTRKILKPMTEGNPFPLNISKDIVKLGIISLIMGVIVNLYNFAITYSSMHLYNVEKMIENSHITSITANYNIDMTFGVIFVVSVLLSYIFKYGEQLQQLSDETV